MQIFKKLNYYGGKKNKNIRSYAICNFNTDISIFIMKYTLKTNFHKYNLTIVSRIFEK